MEESKQPIPGELGAKEVASMISKGKSKTKKNSKFVQQDDSNPDSQDVLLKLPGGFTYKLPGRRQRVVIASIVLGLNLLLLIAVILYFYNPAFQSFVFNVGRS